MFSPRECLHCGETFMPTDDKQIYCLNCLNPDKLSLKKTIRSQSIFKNRPPAKIHIGETYGTLKILERIQGNKFKVQCVRCKTTYIRYIQSYDALIKSQHCKNCKAQYSPYLYRIWQSLVDTLDFADISPAFWTWQGFEAWVRTGSNYNEKEGLIHFYRIGAGEPFAPGNCAFARTRIPLLHDVSIANLTRQQEYVMDSKIEGESGDFLEF